MNQRLRFTISWAGHTALIAFFLLYAGSSTIHGFMLMSMSPERLAELWGAGDAGSYLTGALALVRDGTVGPEHAWILNLWPPGMVVLDAAVIAWSPLPFAVTVALLTAVAWGLTLTLLTWRLIRTRRAILFVVAGELLVLATPPFQTWMLDEAFIYSDGFAAAALISGLTILVLRGLAYGGKALWIRDGVLAGILLAIAVYFRASNNIVPIAIGGLAIVLFVVWFIRRARRQARENLLRHSVLLGVTTLTVLALLAPYAALTLARYGRLQPTMTDEVMYELQWRDPSTQPTWLADAGVPLGCTLDPELCADFLAEYGGPPPLSEARAALVTAIVTHPIPWVMDRVSVVVKQWFRDDYGVRSVVDFDEDATIPVSASWNPNIPMGLFYLGMLVATLILAIRLARRGHWALLVIPLAAAALLAPFAIAHVEVRYLIPLKLIGLLAPTLWLAWRRPPVIPDRVV